MADIFDRVGATMQAESAEKSPAASAPVESGDIFDQVAAELNPPPALPEPAHEFAMGAATSPGVGLGEEPEGPSKSLLDLPQIYQTPHQQLLYEQESSGMWAMDEVAMLQDKGGPRGENRFYTSGPNPARVAAEVNAKEAAAFFGVPVESVEKYRKMDPIDLGENISSATASDWAKKVPFIGSLFSSYESGTFSWHARKLDPLTKKLESIKAEANAMAESDDPPTAERRDKYLKLIDRYLEGVEKVAATPHAKFMREHLDKRAEAIIRTKTYMAEWGSGVANLPKYMVEFLATHRLFAIGKGAGLRFAAKMGVKSGSATALIGAAAGTGARISALLVDTVAEGQHRRLPKVKMGADGAFHLSESDKGAVQAYLGAFANQYLELLTEVSGEAMVKGFTKFMPKTAAMLDNWKVGKPASMVGWHGMPAELGEEMASKFIKSLATAMGVDTGEKGWLMSARELFVTAGVLLVPTVGAVAFNTAKDTFDKPSAEAVAVIVKEMGISEENAAAAIRRAKRGGGTTESLERELEAEEKVSRTGLEEWAAENPENAAELAGKEKPSRKDFAAAGLPRRTGKDRARIAGDLKDITAKAPAGDVGDTGGAEVTEPPITTPEPVEAETASVAVEPAPVEAEPKPIETLQREIPDAKDVGPKSEDEQQAADFAAEHDVNVVFVETSDETFQGRRSENTAFVRSGLSTDLIWETVGHEAAHATGMDTLLEEHADDSDLADARQRTLDRSTPEYRAALEKDSAGLNREAVALLIGEVMRSPEARARLQKANPTLFTKIIEAIRRTITSIKGKSSFADRVLTEFEAQADLDTLHRAAKSFGIPTEGRTRLEIGKDVAKAKRSGRKAKPVEAEPEAVAPQEQASTEPVAEEAPAEVVAETVSVRVDENVKRLAGEIFGPAAVIKPVRIKLIDGETDALSVKLPAGQTVYVAANQAAITFDIKKVAKDTGIPIKKLLKYAEEGRLSAAGKLSDLGNNQFLMELAPGADSIAHEHFHFLARASLSSGEFAKLIKRYGSEEKAADAYRRQRDVTGINTLFDKIRAFIDRLIPGGVSELVAPLKPAPVAPTPPVGELKETEVPVTKKAPAAVTPEAKPKSKGRKVKQGDIYPLGDKVSIRGEKPSGFGDLIFNSREEAETHIAEAAKIERANAKFQAKQGKATAEKAEKEAEKQAVADDIDGFAEDKTALQRGRAKKALNKTLTLSGGEVRTRKDHIREMVADGDVYLGVFDEAKIKPMTPMQSHRATQAEQDAHQKKIDDAGTKKVYRVNGFDLGKTGYDYARFLMGKKAGAKPAHEPTTTIAGKITLDEFEAKGFEADEVTQAEWIELQRANRRFLGQSEESGTKAAPFADYEEFHREAVRRAVEKGEDVDDRVLADYPDLKPEAKPDTSSKAVESAPKPKKKGRKVAKPSAAQAAVNEELRERNKKAPDHTFGEADKPPSTPSTGATGGAMAAIAEGDSFKRDEDGNGPEPPAEVTTRAAAAKATIAEIADSVMEIISPAKRVYGKIADLIRRRRMAEAAQLDEVVRAKLHGFSKLFRFMPEAEIVDFIDRMEDPEGPRPQETAELDEIAAILRETLDKGRARVQKFGVLEEYIENYFPHLFKNLKKAKNVISGLLSKRSLVPKGFLRKRKYLTLTEGLDAGLELAHYNPVEMVILRLHEMHKYVAGKNFIQDLKEFGLAVFVPSDMEADYKRQGWEFVEIPDLIVRATPTFSMKEAYDKLLVDQLLGVATKMGVSYKRMAKMRGRRWGESGPGKRIKTLFAGPESVIAHEIGHQIGDRYGLYDFMLHSAHTIGRVFKSGKKEGQPVKADRTANRAAIRKEFRALADLRIEGQAEVSESHRKYLREEAEKEAVILEAWLAAPKKMAEVAPKITAAWKDFLANNEAVAPLLNLDRSVVLGTSAQTVTLKGVHEIGKWAVPAEAATIINRHLSPGLGSSKNIIIRNVYEGLRRLRNLTLQISHGLSAFHGVNVGGDATNSLAALGMQKISRGDVAGGGKLLAEAPVAWKTVYSLGKKVEAAMRTELEEIADPIMRSIIEAALDAGARASMDAAYRNNAAANLVQAFRNVRFGGVGTKIAGAAAAPVHAAMSLVELLSVPIMKWEVPRLKLGVFYYMASDIYEQANKRGWDDFRIRSEMAEAWDDVENRMGQLNYDNLNWDRTTKEIVMLAFRAPGWTLGSIREFGGGAYDAATFWTRFGKDKDIITSKMAYAFGAAISYALQGMALQYFLSGEPPKEMRDLYFPRTGRKNSDGSDERLSMPHYSKDIVAWLRDPIKTLQHKLNPVWGTATDIFWSNEDYFGRQIREGDTAEQVKQGITYFVNNMFTPFSVRNAFKLHENGETIPIAALIGATGVSPAPAYITRSPAQSLMINYLRGRGGRRHISQADAEMSDRRRQLVRDLRSGKKVTADRWEGFTSRQRTGIKRDAKQTSFQVSFRKLSFNEAVNVFTVASRNERKQVWDRLLKKRIDAPQPDDDVLAIYYELKLTQAQVDNQVAADIRIIRNAAYRLTEEDVPKLRQQELLDAMRSNKQYEDDFRFVAAAFNDRWRFTLKGKRSGRKVGTPAWKKRLGRLRIAFNQAGN